MGCTVDKSDKQSAVLSIQIQEKHLQHLGYIHGGVISTLADNTGWFVVQPYLNENQTAMTQELTINYLYPGKGKLLKAVGILVKMGKTTAFVQVDLFCEDKIIATSSSHLAILEANK
nr:PaaI family thioesterase [Sulfurimonas sp. MAG313]